MSGAAHQPGEVEPERSRPSSASRRAFQLSPLRKLRAVGDAVLAADQRVELRPARWRSAIARIVSGKPRWGSMPRVIEVRTSASAGSPAGEDVLPAPGVAPANGGRCRRRRASPSARAHPRRELRRLEAGRAERAGRGGEVGPERRRCGCGCGRGRRAGRRPRRPRACGRDRASCSTTRSRARRRSPGQTSFEERPHPPAGVGHDDVGHEARARRRSTAARAKAWPVMTAASSGRT